MSGVADDRFIPQPAATQGPARRAPGEGGPKPAAEGVKLPFSRNVVDISDCRFSTDPDDCLITYALGSCIGVTAHDPVARIGALAHFMLPTGTLDPKKAGSSPFMFVDTGITAMLTELFRLGVSKRRLVIKVAGGAALMDQQDRFRIGERNFAILRKFLWKNDLLIAAHDVGGAACRTLIFQIGSGAVHLKMANRLWEL